MFPQSNQPPINPSTMYNALGAPPAQFDGNASFPHPLQNGAGPGTPTNLFSSAHQTFQPGSVVPAKRPHDGMSASPVQGQGSRAHTPSYASFAGQQPAVPQFANQPTPYQHLHQSGSNNPSPSPTMPAQQFRPPTQPPSSQQTPQHPHQRLQNASPNPYAQQQPQGPPQPVNFGHMSPGTPQAQTPSMGMNAQGQMVGFGPQYAMNNMAMAGMGGGGAQAQMNSMGAMGGAMGGMGGTPQNNSQKAYQMRLMQQQQQMRASGMVPPRPVGGPQNPMYNPAPQQQHMVGPMPNGQAGPSLSQKEMAQQKRAQFIRTIIHHAQREGQTIDVNPTINGRPVDLYALWSVVTQFGGSAMVERNSQWQIVANKMGFAQPQYPNAAQQLKDLHAATCTQYERLWFAMRSQQKQQQAQRQASQMAGLGASVQQDPNRIAQNMNQQPQYPRGPSGQQGQPQAAAAAAAATPVQLNAQLPPNGMSTPQQMHHRRNSSVRKPEQMTPQAGATAMTSSSPHSSGKDVQTSPAARRGSAIAMKSEEMQSTNYVPQHRPIELDGGFDTPALFEVGNGISRAVPNMPTVDEMGVIDTKALSLSLASGISGEVRYALDALAIVSNDQRIQFELEKCEDLLDIIIDCADEQTEALSEDATEVSDAVDLLSYEDVIRASRIEADTLQEVAEFGSRAWQLDRAADRLIAITTILRNFSFYEHNHRQLTSTCLVKWLSNTIRLLGTRHMLLRTYYNAQDFYKDAITLLSNVTQGLELPSRDDASHLLHFLLAFAPQPAPRYSESKYGIRFAPFTPAVHKYLPPALDCLSKLLARQHPNRTFYKAIFTSTSSSSSYHATSDAALDILTKAFALAISVLPDRSKGPLPNSQQLRIVEARKAYLTQGMLATDILTSMVSPNDSDLARSWLESEDGWAVGLLSLVPLLSVDRSQPPPMVGGRGRAIGADTESFKLITYRALTMLKRLAEKAGKGSPGDDEMRRVVHLGNGKKINHLRGRSKGAAKKNSDPASAANGTALYGTAATIEGDHEHVTSADPLFDSDPQVSSSADAPIPTLSTEDENAYSLAVRPPKWEGIPQGHAIVGALMMPSTDKVALGLLCGLHDVYMEDDGDDIEETNGSWEKRRASTR